MLAETRAELDDFHASSKELEEELERELERTEKAQQELKVKVARAEHEKDEWKVRLSPIVPPHTPHCHQLQVEIHVPANPAQYYNDVIATGTRHSEARTSEDQDSTSRTGDGQRRP